MLIIRDKIQIVTPSPAVFDLKRKTEIKKGWKKPNKT